MHTDNLTLCHIKMCFPEACSSVQKDFLYHLEKASADTVFSVYVTCFMKAALRAFPPKLRTLKLPMEKTCIMREAGENE